MLCPSCKSVELKMSDRQGVEIDYCPQCRGVWLDRGELDKIIERAGPPGPPGPTGGPDSSRRGRHDDDDDDDRFKHRDGHGYKKRKNPLWEIFDFG